MYSRKKVLNKFLLTKDGLENSYNIALSHLGNLSRSKSVKFRSRLIAKDSETLVANSFADLIEQCESQEKGKIDTLSFKIEKEGSNIELIYTINEGLVIEASHSSEQDLHREIHLLNRRLQKLNNYRPAIIDFFVNNYMLGYSANYFMLLSASMFVLFVGFYIYALHSAVDISPDILPKGNAYFREVEKAISSTSIELKLNVLLKGLLVKFENRSDILNDYKKYSIFSFALFAISVLLKYARRFYQYLYPDSFFAIGVSENEWKKRISVRTTLNVGVVIGFIVSFASGLAILFIFQ